MLSRIDRGALTRAMETAKADRADQLAAMLKDRPWEVVAVFAPCCCQYEALSLKPWQSPPMYAGDERPSDASPLSGRLAAWQLRRRLLAAGLSVFEPDPVRALDAHASNKRGSG